MVTVTDTMPDPAGEVAVQEVADKQDTPDAGLPVPKSTVVPPEAVSKPVPVMVTLVPPAVDPASGLTAVTDGT